MKLRIYTAVCCVRESVREGEEGGSCYVAKSGMELTILPQSPKC